MTKYVLKEIGEQQVIHGNMKTELHKNAIII